MTIKTYDYKHDYKKILQEHLHPCNESRKQNPCVTDFLPVAQQPLHPVSSPETSAGRVSFPQRISSFPGDFLIGSIQREVGGGVEAWKNESERCSLSMANDAEFFGSSSVHAWGGGGNTNAGSYASCAIEAIDLRSQDRALGLILAILDAGHGKATEFKLAM